MDIKKPIALIAISCLFSISSYANSEFKIRVPISSSMSSWNEIELDSSSYGPWYNDGPAFDCSDWTPSASEVNKGSLFTQSSYCTQKKTRTITYQEYDNFSDSYRTSRTEAESKNFSEAKEQQATGTKVTGYYNWSVQGYETIKTYTGTYSDYSTNWEKMDDYIATTKYKKAYYPSCAKWNIGHTKYWAGKSGQKSDVHNTSMVTARGYTYRCEFIYY